MQLGLSVCQEHHSQEPGLEIPSFLCVLPPPAAGMSPWMQSHLCAPGVFVNRAGNEFSLLGSWRMEG